LPSAVTILGYALALYGLSITLRAMPTGIAYAIWSEAGIVFASAVGLLALIGMGLIMAGVVVINVFSRNMGHRPARQARFVGG
jgi:small multidrug resistance pump